MRRLPCLPIVMPQTLHLEPLTMINPLTGWRTLIAHRGANSSADLLSQSASRCVSAAIRMSCAHLQSRCDLKTGKPCMPVLVANWFDARADQPNAVQYHKARTMMRPAAAAACSAANSCLVAVPFCLLAAVWRVVLGALLRMRHPTCSRLCSSCSWTRARIVSSRVSCGLAWLAMLLPLSYVDSLCCRVHEHRSASCNCVLRCCSAATPAGVVHKLTRKAEGTLLPAYEPSCSRSTVCCAMRRYRPLLLLVLLMRCGLRRTVQPEQDQLTIGRLFVHGYLFLFR